MIKVSDRLTQKALDELEKTSKQKFIQKADVKKFKASNFTDDVFEFDVSTVTTTELAKIVATLINKMR